MTRIVIGLFDSRSDADRAAAQLLGQPGVKPESVEVHAAEAEGADAGAGRAPAALDRLALPDEDDAFCREAVRRGGILVAAWVEDSRVEHALETFEANNAVDLDAREAEWRGSGWSGYSGHDEDIGFATYGQDVVVGRIPQRHDEEQPSGALGRLETAAGAAFARAQRDRAYQRARCFIPAGR